MDYLIFPIRSSTSLPLSPPRPSPVLSLPLLLEDLGSISFWLVHTEERWGATEEDLTHTYAHIRNDGPPTPAPRRSRVAAAAAPRNRARYPLRDNSY